MRRSALLIIALTLATAAPLGAATFAPRAIAPDLGIDAFTRGVTRELLGRDVFSNPYATVTISNVDVYDRFPYVEERHFEVVSDPRWNRLVCGELGQGLSAYDGADGPLGALSQPRGLAVDEQGRIYVADAGNDRIVVLQASTEFDRMTLSPLYAIDGLSGPYGVAYSDGGTPFRPGDDYLYVADTGKNRIVAFALSDRAARKVAVLGDLGGGPGRFAGPMAIAVGHDGGANTPDVYVADAHNRRIVHLRHAGGAFDWIGDAPDGADVVTSLDTDAWGNLYAAAPRQGVVRKFTAALRPLADLRDGLESPRAIHVPFANYNDHRDGSVRRVGEASAISIDRWSDRAGVALWSLGVGIQGLRVEDGAEPTLKFTLTDPAALSLDVTDAADGHLVSHRAAGSLAAGAQEIPLTARDLAGVTGAGDLVVRLSAASSYGNGSTDVASAAFHTEGGGAAPVRAGLLGNRPNPARSSTEISFLLPSQSAGDASLVVFDAGGRRVRTFRGAFAPGLNRVTWDGTDDDGHAVSAGLYFCRLRVGRTEWTRRMSVLR